MSHLAASVPHASLLLALQLAARPLSESELATIAGLPLIRVRHALRELASRRFAAPLCGAKKM